MTPSEFQVPPARPSISQMTWGWPPATTSTFWSLLFAEKPTQRLSGDQKGPFGFSVPARAVAELESMERNHSIGFPSLPVATKVIRRPSGESARGAIVFTNFAPSGG